ncbi:hypothetical protein P872_21830 [Rhodonellum psychrophilum GCM71 = DSM 17998]|uniref:Uncharacterized protein n=1 Tax=Rhodonellum psychrophilum GCM71 = DSM 17998 TaxID=1123057 RepID=U5BWY5_9BACT|nr:hypothetical protein P872_21830 [Rhodonellum psychrophilum GCM71 = DSM 17998]
MLFFFREFISIFNCAFHMKCVFRNWPNPGSDDFDWERSFLMDGILLWPIWKFDGR